jgi:hypothetical protein
MGYQILNSLMWCMAISAAVMLLWLFYMLVEMFIWFVRDIKRAHRH